MKIAKELAKQARKFNICQEWHDELKTLEDKRAMAQMYLKGIDFCLANDYPSNDYIRRNFGDIINEFNIFLDDTVAAVNIEKCVALGATTGRVEINGFGVSEIFVKQISKLQIMAKDNAFVMVDIFDNAHIQIHAEGNAKVCVNHYGDSVFECAKYDNARVKIIEKHKKTY